MIWTIRATAPCVMRVLPTEPPHCRRRAGATAELENSRPRARMQYPGSKDDGWKVVAGTPRPAGSVVRRARSARGWRSSAALRVDQQQPASCAHHLSPEQKACLYWKPMKIMCGCIGFSPRTLQGPGSGKRRGLGSVRKRELRKRGVGGMRAAAVLYSARFHFAEKCRSNGGAQIRLVAFLGRLP